PWAGGRWRHGLRRVAGRGSGVAPAATARGRPAGAPVNNLTVRGDLVAIRIRLGLRVHAGDELGLQVLVLGVVRVVILEADAPDRLGVRRVKLVPEEDRRAVARVHGLAAAVVVLLRVHA